MVSRGFAKLVLLGALFISAADAHASTIVKFDLGNTGPDVALTGGVFSTISQHLLIGGDQMTGVDFVGVLASLPDILSGATFSLNNVHLVGNIINMNGSFSQATSGGDFTLYDQTGGVLLAGSLVDGAINGGYATTGSFFNTSIATFTGGSLLAYVLPKPAGISLALTDVFSGNSSGFLSICSTVTGCVLANFTADADGLIEGTSVPEPLTAGLVISGLAAGLLIRRRPARI